MSFRIARFDTGFIDILGLDDDRKRRVLDWFSKEHSGEESLDDYDPVINPNDQRTIISTSEKAVIAGIRMAFYEYGVMKAGENPFWKIIRYRIKYWLDNDKDIRLLPIAKFQQFIDDMIDEEDGEFDVADFTPIQRSTIITIGGLKSIKYIDELEIIPDNFSEQWNLIMSLIMTDKLSEQINNTRLSEASKKLLIKTFAEHAKSLDFAMFPRTSLKPEFEKKFEELQNQIIQKVNTLRFKARKLNQKEIDSGVVVIGGVERQLTSAEINEKRLKVGVDRTRPLTEEEIEQLSTVRHTYSFRAVTEPVAERLKDDLKKQLRSAYIEPDLIPDLEREITNKFKQAKIPDDYRVGLIAAQTVGEQATQAGLRSFKHAGKTGDTGFSRMKALTGMNETPTNPFTTITLAGNPSWAQARYYANLLESMSIGSLCTMEVGTTVENDTLIFTRMRLPYFPIEPWHAKYDTMFSGSGRPGRSKWIIRCVCNTDTMFQRKISLGDLAIAIEKKISDVRVAFSSFKVGIMEIWFKNMQMGESIQGTNPDESKYIFLSREMISNIKSTEVTKSPGLTETMVNKFNLSSYIEDASNVSGGVVVSFDQEDFLMRAIPNDQAIAFLKMKAQTNNVREIDIGQFFVETELGADNLLKNRILQVETVSIFDLIHEPVFTDTNAVITFNRAEVLGAHQINFDTIIDFFIGQANLARFLSVEVEIHRADMTITITRSKNVFDGEVLKKQFLRSILIEDAVKQAPMEVQGRRLIVKEVPLTVDSVKLRKFKLLFGNTVKFDFRETGETVELTFEAQDLSFQDTWHDLATVIGPKGDSIPAVFTSERKERLNERFYIFARGSIFSGLADWPFIDMNGVMTSHPPEMYRALGIEAMRAYLYTELMENGGKEVAKRHISLISDSLSFIGVPTPISKKGKEIMQSGPFARAAFQETFKTFLAASLEGAQDSMHSTVTRTAVGEFVNPMPKGESTKEYVPQMLESTLDELMTAGNMIKTVKREPKIDERLPRIMPTVEKDSGGDVLVLSDEEGEEYGGFDSMFKMN